MKRSILKMTSRMAIVMALFGMIFVTSCKDDSDDPIDGGGDPVVEDGLYLKGSASQYTDFNIKALLKSTKNEVGQVDKADLYEIYIAMKAGSFSIVNVAGAARTSYGPASDWATAPGGNEEPQLDFQRGSVEESATEFTVPADGIYHVVIDLGQMKAAVIPVAYWGIIGGATPNGWSGDTELDAGAFDLNEMSYTGTGIALTLGDYKFRYSGGWKAELDSTYDPGTGGDKGLKVNCNFGGSPDALVPGGDNITLSQSGYYDITMTWKDGEGWAVTMTRTGDLPTKDWTDIQLGLIGDGVKNMGTQHDWSSGLWLHKPTVNGKVFTWTWNGTEVASAGSFKIREGDNWDNAIIGYNDVTMAGADKGDFSGTTPDGNFQAAADGTYDIVLSIDASTEEQTVTVTKK